MLQYTLVGDGPSDRALLPVLNWLISQHANVSFSGSFAQFLPPLRDGLGARLQRAMELFPASIYFVHRDAERAGFAIRKQEVVHAVPIGMSLYVALVPVRMTEAWLLSDETAVRHAADYPSGVMPLGLPNPNRWDREPDPKRVLLGALKTASGLSGRRLRKFDPSSRRIRVAELTESFGVLRRLDAFRELENDIQTALTHLGV